VPEELATKWQQHSRPALHPPVGIRLLKVAHGLQEGLQLEECCSIIAACTGQHCNLPGAVSLAPLVEAGLHVDQTCQDLLSNKRTVC